MLNLIAFSLIIYRTASAAQFNICTGEEPQGLTMGDNKSANLQLPNLAKQKLPVSESTKPSKSKLRRPQKHLADPHNLTTTDVFQTLPLMLPDPNLRFNDLSSSFSEDGILGFNPDEDSLLDMSELFSFNYEPDITSGLDDLSNFPEFTDIG